MAKIWPTDAVDKKEAMGLGKQTKNKRSSHWCPGILFLKIEKAGEHEIQFSMREDGFEFDQWIMTTDPKFIPPKGPSEISPTIKGKTPKPFQFVEIDAGNNNSKNGKKSTGKSDEISGAKK